MSTTFYQVQILGRDGRYATQMNTASMDTSVLGVMTTYFMFPFSHWAAWAACVTSYF